MAPFGQYSHAKLERLDSLACARASRIVNQIEGSGQGRGRLAHRKVRYILIGDGGDRGNLSPPHSEGSLSISRTQIFTGKQPFYPNTDERVILLLAQDVRPAKPDHNQLTPTLWTLTKKCWDKDPKKRPNVTKVLTKLGLRDGAFSFINSGPLARSDGKYRKEAI